ncbi:MAG: SDR family NAD(P)-dependent oxidoreductase [Deltaproteobacteria bacterium]|nr:SDR family NAD(P)-dependent oxidoreductase [Deltaproteobacteria bacterium]
MGLPNIRDLFDIKGKVALITGATGGFGHAAALGLAAAGAKIMVTGRSEKNLQPIVEEITDAGRAALCCAGSAIDEQDVNRIVDTCVDGFGGIDILVTAAGVNKPGAIICVDGGYTAG